MTDYGSMGTPVAIAGAISLNPGQWSDQREMYTVPSGQLFIIEFVSIAASLQPQQDLCAAILPVFDGGLTTYSIMTPGKTNSHNTQMPLRRFGSQQVLLYANQRVEVSAIRSDDADGGHVEFNISGRLLVPNQNIQPPSGVRVIS
jgi:hypothetical protein